MAVEGNCVCSRFKNTTGSYAWLRSVDDILEDKILEDNVNFFRKDFEIADAGSDKDDDEESGEETPKKLETSRNRPKELSKALVPKKVKFSTHQQKTDGKIVTDFVANKFNKTMLPFTYNVIQ